MVVPQGWKAEPPEDDDGYFERMTKAIFQAGLNWRMIENKWPNFRKAFDQFSAKRVSSFGEKEVKALMGDTGIVRNERKIRSVIDRRIRWRRLPRLTAPLIQGRKRETSSSLWIITTRASWRPRRPGST